MAVVAYTRTPQQRLVHQNVTMGQQRTHFKVAGKGRGARPRNARKAVELDRIDSHNL